MVQKLYKKVYNVKEFYVALHQGLRTFKHMHRGKKKNQLSKPFIERIMLAVTEVNGCEVCSYAHTKIALKQGMSSEEINMLLSGNLEEVSEDEMTAIMFAQHYADTRGNPSIEAWDSVVATYGNEKALGILGTVRTIMVGNIYGIGLSAFKSRLKGKKIAQTNLFYELKIIVSIIPVVPVAFIHALISSLLKTPLTDFDDYSIYSL